MVHAEDLIVILALPVIVQVAHVEHAVQDRVVAGGIDVRVAVVRDLDGVFLHGILKALRAERGADRERGGPDRSRNAVNFAGTRIQRQAVGQAAGLQREADGIVVGMVIGLEHDRVRHILDPIRHAVRDELGSDRAGEVDVLRACVGRNGHHAADLVGRQLVRRVLQAQAELGRARDIIPARLLKGVQRVVAVAAHGPEIVELQRLLRFLVERDGQTAQRRAAEIGKEHIVVVIRAGEQDLALVSVLHILLQCVKGRTVDEQGGGILILLIGDPVVLDGRTGAVLRGILHRARREVDDAHAGGLLHSRLFTGGLCKGFCAAVDIEGRDQLAHIQLRAVFGPQQDRLIAVVAAAVEGVRAGRHDKVTNIALLSLRAHCLEVGIAAIVCRIFARGVWVINRGAGIGLQFYPEAVRIPINIGQRKFVTRTSIIRSITGFAKKLFLDILRAVIHIGRRDLFQSVYISKRRRIAQLHAVLRIRRIRLL